MQTSAYFVAQAFFGDNGNQRDVDDNAYRQYNGRPGDAVRDMAEPFDQKFQCDAKNRNLYEKVEGACKDRKGEFMS